jgi:hypothetical protein
MRVFVGLLLATVGIVLVLGYVALSMYFYIKQHSDDPPDRYVDPSFRPGLKKALLLGALGLSGMVLAVVGFEILT